MTSWTDLLRQIIELSTEERSLPQVMRRVAEFVVATMGADVCFVHVVDHEAKELVLMGATPEQFGALAGTIRLQIGEGLAGWVAEHGVPAVVDDKWNDPRYVYIPALRGEDFKSMLSVPMLRPGSAVVGVLNVHSQRADQFHKDDADRLSEVASLLAGIVENAVLFDRLANREAELERFAARTIELQELDRRRIAADIHDGISQRLVSAWYHLRAARSLLESASPLDEVNAEVGVIELLLSEALGEARGAIVGLRPAVLDDLGLNAAITSVANSLGADVEIELDLDAVVFQPHVETALYRLTQEALQNVAKHARASRIRISLEDGDEFVRYEIVDDGVGFDQSRAVDSTSFGLEGMQERAALLGAHLEVRSRLGEGTSVVVTLPHRARSASLQA